MGTRVCLSLFWLWCTNSNGYHLLVTFLVFFILWFILHSYYVFIICCVFSNAVFIQWGVGRCYTAKKSCFCYVFKLRVSWVIALNSSFVVMHALMLSALVKADITCMTYSVLHNFGPSFQLSLECIFKILRCTISTLHKESGTIIVEVELACMSCKRAIPSRLWVVY